MTHLLLGCRAQWPSPVKQQLSRESPKHLSSRLVLSFCSSVRLYAWPVAECCAVISQSRQRRRRRRHRSCDLQTALVPHEVMGGNRFSMLSSSSKRYYTPATCSGAGRLRSRVDAASRTSHDHLLGLSMAVICGFVSGHQFLPALKYII